MLVQCWASVADGGPTLNQHLVKVSSKIIHIRMISVSVVVELVLGIMLEHYVSHDKDIVKNVQDRKKKHWCKRTCKMWGCLGQR